MEIPPCVLQDIGPLGSLPKKLSLSQVLDGQWYQMPLSVFRDEMMRGAAALKELITYA